MKWKKQGLVFFADDSQWWAGNGYAFLPTVDIVDDQLIRVYYSALDSNNYGRIGYVDLDINDPHRILYTTPEPIMELGEIGTFADCGVNPSAVLNFNGTKFLYYIGWQRCTRIPYMVFAGVAISNDGKSFSKVSHTPMLERNNTEPFLRSATTIIQDGNILKMWYVSGVRWTIINGRQYPSNVIRSAYSTDGFSWESSDNICINFKDDDEFGLSRPWVVKDGDTYRMWYSIRSRSRPYRIGYAESDNGLNWHRMDDTVGIDRSDTGWDSEMICYPCVVDVRGQRLMFYNGNRHGQSGFGYAILE